MSYVVTMLQPSLLFSLCVFIYNTITVTILLDICNIIE